VKSASCLFVLLLCCGASSLQCTDAALGISATVVRSCSIAAREKSVSLEKSCAVKVAYRVGGISDLRIVNERPACTIAIASGEGTFCGARVERHAGQVTVNF
jgi:hypothetical protein